MAHLKELDEVSNNSCAAYKPAVPAQSNRGVAIGGVVPLSLGEFM